MHPNFSSAVSHRFAMAAGVSRPNSGIATSSTGRDRTEMKGILTERQQICLVAVLSARKAVSQKEWMKHRLTREHHPLLPVRSFFTHLDINRITHVLRLTRKKQRQKFCPHTDGLQGTTYPHLRCCEADSGGWTGGCRLVKDEVLQRRWEVYADSRDWWSLSVRSVGSTEPPSAPLRHVFIFLPQPRSQAREERLLSHLTGSPDHFTPHCPTFDAFLLVFFSCTYLRESWCFLISVSKTRAQQLIFHPET